VKKVTTCILLIIFGLVLSIPAASHARSNPAQAAQKNNKKLARRNAKQAKKDRKMSQKATRNWKKHHPKTVL
jgi:hypothetical protein